MDTDVPRSKYCDKSPRDDPQGKNPHTWIDTKSDQGVDLVIKRNDRARKQASVNAEYRKVVEIIDKVSGDAAGSIVELVGIAETQVKWMDDFEERLSLYELIIKRIKEATERL